MRRYFVVTISGLVCAAVVWAMAPGTAWGGSIKGTVRLAGAPVKPKKLPATIDQHVWGKEKEAEDVILSPDNGIRYAVVSLQTPPEVPDESHRVQRARDHPDRVRPSFLDANLGGRGRPPVLCGHQRQGRIYPRQCASREVHAPDLAGKPGYGNERSDGRRHLRRHRDGGNGQEVGRRPAF